jgi:membrane-bound lytic murein transglycosylase B
MTCVRDFQVAFALDTNEDGTIDAWDAAGSTANGYSASDLRKRLKQVLVYILVQVSDRDPNYTYPATSVRVGDRGLGTGRDVTLTAAQRQYRWRVIPLNITPRNIR